MSQLMKPFTRMSKGILLTNYPTSRRDWDILKWQIDEIDVDSSVEITYKIKGSGDYHPRDLELSY
ncbi:MAG: hypothetical protein R6U96_18040 [Promethearchaeia archaeon]